MEQIDAQVSDLRYLSQAAVPLPPDRAATAAAYSPHNHSVHSPLSATPGDNSAQQPGASRGATQVGTPGSSSVSGSKRKSEDEINAAKQQRSKRNRYISIACNECKRRKIKCNGETPCQRCGNLNLQCLYAPNCCSNNFKDSDEYKTMAEQMTRLQEQVDNLYQNMNALRSETLRLAPIQDKVLPFPSSTVQASPASSLSPLHRPELTQPKQASFRGPTSMAFSLDIANTTIHNMGYKGIGEDEQGTPLGVPEDSPFRMPPQESQIDPLWDFGKDEMIRLCRLHDEEIGIMYPVIKIPSVIEHVRHLTAYMDSARKQGLTPSLNDEKTLQLKIVMSCALVVEEHGHSEKACKLIDSMDAVLNRKLMVEAVDFVSLPVLALLAGYRFLANEEILAWRVMGQVTRLCLEMGIHRTTGIAKIKNEEDRKNALNSFWSAYVLDRRWAFNTGLPFVVPDEEIDPELPMPEEYPYLVAMISYSRLGAKVWRQVTDFGPVLARELRHEDMERLDQEILQWYENVPEEVKLRNWDKEKQMTSTPSYNLQRLRIWTYLRFNQIRIWLYTPILHSATSIMSHFAQAQRVVDLAKDTIRYLSHLNNTTNLYRKIQVFYHQFLTSAISVLFLASVHAPVRFSPTCREEFYMALELVKDLSAKSWVSKRLWRTISSLKEVAPSIGLRNQPDEDAHSSAALTMAGLASGGRLPNSPAAIAPFGRPSTTPTIPQQQTTNLDTAHSPNNGVRIQNEMSRIFEGYLGLNGFASTGDDGFGGQSDGSIPPTTTAVSNPYVDNVFFHFREMF
ncbi:fungal specific transcription factor domain-containing protein [Colletotrichum orchidophilum]|uniref:Fungal specific transcription factor domain-containing protein n=1 Tax=Colletotrichum orchidophilum TaxID=1209926 RepID=A0A1G4AVC6_9PEZI|nr:fungal specific transcription factor domain-containing protein [Colletotrichum orchidophilum]OHE93055.1 fungal specific transcription factor domain-containing protein [Colletotrichum orchidophilum]